MKTKPISSSRFPYQRPASKRKLKKEAQNRFFFHLEEARKAALDAGIDNIEVYSKLENSKKVFMIRIG